MTRKKVSELIDAVKAQAALNEGEIPYWGERVVLPEAPAAAPSTKAAAQAGVPRGTGVNAAPRVAKAAAAENGAASTSGTRVPMPAAPPANAPADGDPKKAAALEKLRVETIGDCQRCPLGKSRIKLVFGVGNPGARVMFVGEGPGFDEDRKGEPFVGRAGQLLDKIMAAIDLDRTKVYIANVAKCHPMVDPSNPDKRGNDRPPTPEEMAECLPFLKAQIAIIRPEIIVTLGGTATKALLGTTQGITSLRGKITEIILDDGTRVPVLPTFHPAALLRNPEHKKPVWEDMKLLRARLSGE